MCGFIASSQDSYEQHWGSKSSRLGVRTVEELSGVKWKQTTFKGSALGDLSQLVVEGGAFTDDVQANTFVSTRLFQQCQGAAKNRDCSIMLV